jgi:hypothetical protein
MPDGANRGSHYDFMLEVNSSLKAWAIEKLPTAKGPITAIELPDHRIEYLEYEGPVSDNRGTVRRVDGGLYELVAESESRLKITIDGQLLNGLIVLNRCDDDWQLSYQPSTKRNKA